jgi:hypothetical protein
MNEANELDSERDRKNNGEGRYDEDIAPPKK